MEIVRCLILLVVIFERGIRMLFCGVLEWGFSFFIILILVSLVINNEIKVCDKYFGEDVNLLILVRKDTFLNFFF